MTTFVYTLAQVAEHTRDLGDRDLADAITDAAARIDAMGGVVTVDTILAALADTGRADELTDRIRTA